MNLTERNMIYKVYELLNAVPGAHQFGSTQTATISGVANFAADMSFIRDHLSRALMALFDGSLTREQRADEFTEAISKAERYIMKRSAVDWDRLSSKPAEPEA